MRSLGLDFLIVFRKVLTVTLKDTGAAAVDFDLGETEDDLTGNATVHTKRDGPYTVQYSQEPKMVHISPPRNVVGGLLLWMLGGQYFYPKMPGGVAFYIHDRHREILAHSLRFCQQEVQGADDTNRVKLNATILADDLLTKC